MNTVIVESFKGRNATFKDLTWTLKAASKSDTQPNIQGVLIKDEVMVATDGARLHKAELTKEGTELPAGYYQILKVSKDQIILQQTDDEFPHWQQCIPGSEPEKTKELHCEIPRKRKVNHSRTFSQAIRMLAENYYFDYNLFCETVDGGENWVLNVYAPGDPVTLRNGNKLAIIMPRAIKD